MNVGPVLLLSAGFLIDGNERLYAARCSCAQSVSACRHSAQ
jgi:hypothetical protein